MDIQIRHALTDDLNGILRVFQQCVDYHRALMPDVYGSADMEAFKNSMLELVNENGRIDCLVTDENHHHQGIGSRLIAAAEAYLQKHHIHEMTLTVLINNSDAIKCYEKAGFIL